MKKFILIITLATITQCAYSADESAISEDQREFINLFFRTNVIADENSLLEIKKHPDTVRTFLNSLCKGGELYESSYNSFFQAQSNIGQADSLEELMVLFGSSMVLDMAPILKAAVDQSIQATIQQNNIEKSDLNTVNQIKNVFMKTFEQTANLTLATQKEMLLNGPTDSPDLLSIKNNVLLRKKAYTFLKEKGIKSLDKNQFEPIFEKNMKYNREMIENFISEKGPLVSVELPTQEELNSPEIKHLSLIALNAAPEFKFENYQ